MNFGNPVRGVIRPLNWHRPNGNHEPKLTQAFKGQEPNHDGIDISCAGESVEIVAMEAGRVVFAGFQSSTDRSINVVVDHGELRTLIGHFRKEIVSVGETVKKGQRLGFMGATGVSTGVHAHVEVFRESDNRRLDPWPLLEQNQPDITVRPKDADGIRIRKQPEVNGQAFAETDHGWIVRLSDNKNLGDADQPRKWGGTVDGGQWTLPNGQTGRKWERIWLDSAYRHLAAGLAVVSK